MMFIKIIFVGLIFSVSSQSFAHDEDVQEVFTECVNGVRELQNNFYFGDHIVPMKNCIKLYCPDIGIKTCYQAVNEISPWLAKDCQEHCNK